VSRDDPKPGDPLVCPRCKGEGRLRFITKLEAMRLARGWTRDELARRTHTRGHRPVTARAITALETGANKSARWDTIRSLLRAFDLIWEERGELFDVQRMSYWLRTKTPHVPRLPANIHGRAKSPAPAGDAGDRGN
jgi:transcriptional regulator with XRE-family HTH domain